MLDAGTIHVWRFPDAVAADAQREILSTAIAPAALAYAKHPHGKPHLPDGPFFNRSHSGEFLLLAVSRDVEVGVDLEAPRVVGRRDALLRRSFSDAEAAWIGADDTRLIRAWAAKEAIVKAIGRGIAFGLRRVEVVASGDSLRVARVGDEATSGWQLREFAWRDGYRGALAWCGPELAVTWRDEL